MIRNDHWPHVILVNGPSSAGKTTLCRALQARLDHPYLRVGFDDFIFFSPPRYYRGADTAGQAESDAFTSQGVQMVATSLPGAPLSVSARFGPVFRRLIDSMAPAVCALVEGGNPVIFDHVLHEQSMYESCQRAFGRLNVFKVGVVCDLDILEAREKMRGDRVLGRARGLAEVVHTFCTYDVVVNTGEADVNGCVDTICDALAGAQSGSSPAP